ncbi:MAG: CocE/NonD family hydrolase [Solirubrobacterales bacterium]|nr:CocE/NonD family hydrolase [Solirubrobacterales bacterium]
MRSIRVYLAALAAVVVGMFLVSGLATTSAGAAVSPYAKLKQQRAKQIKKCNKAVAKAKKTKNKAKIRKAKKKSKNCIKQAKKRYTKNLKKLAPQSNASAPYKARGSVGDAYVMDAKPGSFLMLVNAQEKLVAKGVADEFGSKIFYDIKPGAGYSVRTRVNARKVQGTKKFQVLAPGKNPPQSFYDSKPQLKAGLNYVTMRDGVEIAMTVRLPMGKTMADGPFPTYIEYSGYQTAAPHDLLNVFLGGGGNDPLAPASSTAVGSLIGPLTDFATVSVQMRGSGCSGGAFDLFGWPTTYDGYDAVETVAAQDWVQGGVGMGGISFSGITQLFTAGTQPPHLAAVSPLSVTDDVYFGTGFPGGIFNNGFAFSWISERADDAMPAPEGGQTWAKVMTTTGDPDVPEPLRSEQKQHCLDNQEMRLQTRSFNDEIENNPYRTETLFGKRSPGAWVKDIEVPIFWVGAFQDEQTGGHWPEAVTKLPKDNENVWVTMQNGVHVDSLGPSTITRWAEFMNLFVGDGRIPKLSPVVIGASSTLYNEIASAGALPIQQTRWAALPNTPANVATALSEFKQDPRIRILMDNGAAIDGDPGAIGAAWETDFTDWPVPSMQPTDFYLGDGGTLESSKPAAQASDSYVSDPSARPAKTLGPNAQGDSWLAQPPYDWQPVVDGKGLGYTSPALAQDVFIAGPSSVDLYLKSSAANTDVQVTLTEVRPDGKETYIQNGWLRSSHRALDEEASTANNPVQTWQEKDAADLESGEFNLMRVQIFPVAHVFRAGSKIRLNIQAPGGDRTIWNFDTIENGSTTNDIGLGGAIPSKLVLPVIPGETAQGTDLPPPTALRGQPSREYEAAANGG